MVRDREWFVRTHVAQRKGSASGYVGLGRKPFTNHSRTIHEQFTNEIPGIVVSLEIPGIVVSLVIPVFQPIFS